MAGGEELEVFGAPVGIQVPEVLVIVDVFKGLAVKRLEDGALKGLCGGAENGG